MITQTPRLSKILTPTQIPTKKKKIQHKTNPRGGNEKRKKKTIFSLKKKKKKKTAKISNIHALRFFGDADN